MTPSTLHHTVTPASAITALYDAERALWRLNTLLSVLAHTLASDTAQSAVSALVFAEMGEDLAAAYAERATRARTALEAVPAAVATPIAAHMAVRRASPWFTHFRPSVSPFPAPFGPTDTGGQR